MANPTPPNRKDLAKVFDNPETIRKFEQLFILAGDLTPEQIQIILRRLDELLVAVGNVSGSANSALAQIADLAQQAMLAPPAHSFAVDISKAIQEVLVRPLAPVHNHVKTDYIEFNRNPAYPGLIGDVAWSTANDTLNIHHSDGVTQQVGQELYGRILNNTAALIPNGTALGINPSTNSYVPFIANGTLSPLNIVGVTTQDIPVGANGRITVWGRVNDLNTTGAPYGEAWVAGDILYVSTTIAGGFTKNKPTAPNLSIPIAQVLVVNATTGVMAVRPTVEQRLFYGEFVKTTDQTPAAANTAYALTWDSALFASGVTIGAPASRIVASNAGLYRLSISLQLTSGSASVKNVYTWMRRNGVDVANTSMVTSMDSATAVRTPSRDFIISLSAGDYIEIMFASTDTAVTVDSLAATAFAPAAPAAILSVSQEQQ